MRRSFRVLLLTAALLVAVPEPVYAGMPSFDLTDVARLRLQSISFFLAAFLGSSWLIQRLWNYLRKDFAFLPRLTYGKALGAVGLWGLLFLLVLTMISGARELMTPGAWEKKGATYRLATPKTTPDAEESREWARFHQLDRLRAALWEYARTHDGHFPSDTSVSAIPRERWQVPDPCGMKYVYVTGLTAGQGAALLAYEPELFSPPRLVLLTNGEIRRLGRDEFAQTLAAEKP